jgi:hypothetical protein
MTSPPIWQRGDFVRLTVGTDVLDAMVTLASPCGGSLMLMFDGAARVGGGLAVGMLPVLRAEDGSWSEIMFGTPVEIGPRDTSEAS